MNLEKLLRNKYIYDLISRKSFISKEEILENVNTNFVEIFSAKIEDLSATTIKRSIGEIKEMFNVDVIYSHIKKGYYIESSGLDESVSDVLDSLNLFYLINNTPNALNHIRFAPRKAIGIEYFFEIVKAIESKKKILFIYTHYEKKESTQRKVSPLGLKEFKGFWYLVSLDGGIIKNFGLDRISGLRIINEKSAAKKDFSMEKHFEHSYGIVNFPDEEPQEVLIKMKPIKWSYYKAKPLHHTQKLVEETADYTIISLYIKFTYDLKQELRSHAKGELEVLKPENGLDGEERYY